MKIQGKLAEGVVCHVCIWGVESSNLPSVENRLVSNSLHAKATKSAEKCHTNTDDRYWISLELGLKFTVKVVGELAIRESELIFVRLPSSKTLEESNLECSSLTLTMVKCSREIPSPSFMIDLLASICKRRRCQSLISVTASSPSAPKSSARARCLIRNWWESSTLGQSPLQAWSWRNSSSSPPRNNNTSEQEQSMNLYPRPVHTQKIPDISSPT